MKGYVDVHYPCHEHVKVQIRIILPKALIQSYDHKIRGSFFDAIATALGIPRDETYEMQFSEAEGGVIYGNRTNRDGISDGI